MKTLKQLLKSDEIIVSVGCYDPLSALALKKTGFNVAYLGGWAVGSHLGVSEPLTTLTEMATIAKNICHVAEIPLIVDAGSAFGNATMVKRCVRSFEQVGVQGIHLEDQIVPKRLDYHVGKHFIISIDEMMLKLDCAMKARKSDDFAIIARTDAGRNKDESFEKAIERAKIYATSGVDMVKTFARNEEEMILAPKKIDFPLCYVASEGLGRPIPTPKEAKELGYKAIFYPLTAIIAAYSAVSEAYQNLYTTGRSNILPEKSSRLSKEIMSLISINELVTLEDPKTL